MEPPYNGHFGTVLTCPLYGGILDWEVKIYCKYNGRDQCELSSIQRCPLLGVSVNGGSTVYKLFMGVKVIGSHVRTNKKLPATQAFCPEKWPAADRYNHLCIYKK